MHNVDFCARFLPANIIFSRSIHAEVYVSISCLFIARSRPTERIQHVSLLSSADGHLGGFYFLAVMNMLLRTRVHMFAFLSGADLGLELLGRMGTLGLTF